MEKFGVVAAAAAVGGVVGALVSYAILSKSKRKVAT